MFVSRLSHQYLEHNLLPYYCNPMSLNQSAHKFSRKKELLEVPTRKFKTSQLDEYGKKKLNE